MIWRWLRGANRPARQQLMEAVPVRNELVKAKRVEGEEGTGRLGATVLLLTAPLARGRLRMLTGQGARAEKTFELDELGAGVWDALNGKRTVEGVIRWFAESKRVNLREAEVAVLAFLKMLVRRNLVGLAVEKKTKKTAALRRR